MEQTQEKMGVVNRIVILHGWTYSTSKWNDLVARLESLGFAVSLLLVPGLTKKSEKVWDLPLYAEWLRKELEKFPSKVILVGHSNGGRIASYYVAKNKAKVAKLVLIAPSGLRGGYKAEAKRHTFKLVAKLGRFLFPFTFAKKILYKVAGEQDYLKAKKNMQETMKNLINFNIAEILHEINVPTTIIWGNLDKVTPLFNANVFHQKIKNSELHIISGASHSPFTTHVEQVANLITKS